MPPSGKLPDEKVAAFEKWIAAGAPDPREATPERANAAAAKRGIDINAGRKWWAFQPVKPQPKPKIKDEEFAKQWAKGSIDSFILAAIAGKESATFSGGGQSNPSVSSLAGPDRSAAKRTTRSGNSSPIKIPRRTKKSSTVCWHRRNMERVGGVTGSMSRYAEDNPTTEATPPYPFAWRYRDWVIEAINKDVPYDRFVKLQLAADLMPDTPRDDFRALGYLGRRRSIIRTCGFRKTSRKRFSMTLGMSGWTRFPADCLG